MQTTRLPHKQRPIEVDSWLKDAGGAYPVVSDTVAYAESWRLWWIECQPKDRATAQWPLPREPLSMVQWGRLMNGGKHGVFLFVVSLSWWVKSSEPAPSSPGLAAAIRDLNWVLHQLTDALTTPALEAPDTSRSKRKIILTDKAVAGGEKVQKRYRR